jgi:MFS family permease
MSRRLYSIGPAAILACAALLLDGWAGLLVPTLVRQLEADFGQSDAGVGAWFFVNAVAYASGSIVGGLLTERLGRRAVLTAAMLLLAIGLAGLASVPSWGLMLVAAVPFGMGGGRSMAARMA